MNVDEFCERYGAFTDERMRSEYREGAMLELETINKLAEISNFYHAMTEEVLKLSLNMEAATPITKDGWEVTILPVDRVEWEQYPVLAPFIKWDQDGVVALWYVDAQPALFRPVLPHLTHWAQYIRALLNGEA